MCKCGHENMTKARLNFFVCLPKPKPFWNLRKFTSLITTSTGIKNCSKSPHLLDVKPHKVHTKSPVSLESNISNELVKWALNNKITNIAFSQLLKILAGSGLQNLPKNSRTLLQARENETEIITVPPGVYIHYGIKKNVEKLIITFVEKKLILSDKIELSVFIDNLPLTKTFNRGLWAILGSVIGLNEAIFLIGAYSGTSKPNDANLFLNAFVTEATDLYYKGMEVNKKTYHVVIKRIICDAPAKAFILNIKNFSGYSSCTKCDTTGEYIGNKICFPDKANPRTDKNFEDSYLYKDVKSKLLQIPKFGVVSNMPLDYLHLVCLGVTKKLISIWVNQDRENCSSKNKLFIKIARNCPSEFKHKPKSLISYEFWNPSQFRQFLLYYGPIVLKDILPKPFFDHFMLLHASCRIFCMNHNSEMVDFGEEMLNEFVVSHKSLYGKEQMTHNVHGLYHLAEDYRLHGTLDGFSAFPFEKFLVKLRNSVRLTRKRSLPHTCLNYSQESVFERSLQSITNRRASATNKIKSINIDLQMKFKHDNEYERLKTNDVEIMLDKKGDAYVLLKDGKIVKVLHILETRENGQKSLFIAGNEYLLISSLYKSPLESSLLGIFRVNNLSEKIGIWPVTRIDQKCMFVPSKKEGDIMIVMLPQDF